MNIRAANDSSRMAAMATMPLGRLLGIAGRLISGRFEKILDDRGVSHTGWVVLLKLEETDDLTQGDVAERCFVRPATLTSVVDALEAAGWLTRTRDAADRRVVRLRLTDSGRTHVAATRQVMQQRMAPVFADMSAKDEAVVRRFLTAVITQLSHPDAKGPHDSER